MLPTDQAGWELETDHQTERRGDLYQGFLAEKQGGPAGGFMREREGGALEVARQGKQEARSRVVFFLL